LREIFLVEGGIWEIGEEFGVWDFRFSEGSGEVGGGEFWGGKGLRDVA
jgi:hypothetical protein